MRSFVCVLSLAVASACSPTFKNQFGDENSSGDELSVEIDPAVLASATIAIVIGDGQTGTVGQTLANPFIVIVKDASNSPLPSVRIDWVVAGGGGTLFPAMSMTDAAGLASSTLTLGALPGANTVTATIRGTATSVTFTATATAGPVTSLVFATQPSTTGNTDTDLAAQPVVEARDALGNVVAAYGSAITLDPFSNTNCTGAVAGGLQATTNPETAVAGVATFAAVRVLKTNVRSIRATDGTLSVCSNALTISSGAFSLAQSELSVSSATVAAGGSITATLTARDAHGNANPSGITGVTFSSDNAVGSGTFGGTTDQGGGVYTATFTGAGAGGLTLSGLINLAAIADTEAVTVTAGGATKLAFSTEPSNAGTAGTDLAQQPEVSIQDALGNTVTGSTATVTLALYSDNTCTTAVATSPNGGGSLGGTLSVAAIAGVSTFTDVDVRAAGATLFLRASSGLLATDCSAAMNISAGAVSLAESTLGVSAATVASGSSITVTLTGKDAYGNSNPSGVGAVTYSSSAVGGTGSFGATTHQGSGVYTADFTGAAAGAVTLSGLIGGSLITDTENVTVTHGTINSLAFSTAPSTTGDTDNPLANQPVVAGKDAAGNTVTTYAGSVTLAAYSDTACTNAVVGGLTATTNPETAVSGVATFAGVKILKTSVQSIRASDGTRTVCFDTLTISAGAPVSIAVSSGDAQTGGQGTALTNPFVAVVRDANLNVVPGVTVNWAVTGGGGSLSSASNATNASGLSSSTLTLGGAGAQTATATIDGTATSVTFNATSTSTPLADNWPFTFGTDADYSFNTSQIEFTGGVCALKTTDRVDDDDSVTGFGGGVASGVAWDATHSYLRLSQTGTPINGANLDASWTPQWSSLISYWKFDNDWQDSKGTNHGTAGSGASFSSSSKVGAAAGSFNGTVNGYVSMGDIDAMDGASKLTMGGWVYPTAYGGYPHPTVIGKGVDNTHAFSMTISNDTSEILVLVANGSSNYGVAPAGTFALNTWSHWLVVFDGTQGVNANRLKLYVNGVLRPFSAIGAMPATLPSNNGAFRVGFGGFDGDFSGKVDDVAIWSTALTASEVGTVYERQSAKYSGSFLSRVMDGGSAAATWTSLAWVPTMPFGKQLPDAGCAAPCAHSNSETTSNYPSLVGSAGALNDDNLMSGIVGLWHLNETAATAGGNNDFRDDSGNGHHGEQSSGVTFGAAGQFGKAASLDGTDDSIILGSSTVSPTSHTVSLWLYERSRRSNADAAYGNVIYEANTLDPYYNSVSSNNGVIHAAIHPSNAWVNTGVTIPLQQWTHLVIRVNSGSNVRIYVNGKQEYSGATGAFGGRVLPMNLGEYERNFNGYFDEVAIWNRALHATEIMQLYRRGANRLKHQVRVCTAADCSDDATGANWKGPDGTRYSYFTELNTNSVPLTYTGNVLKNPPTMAFSDFTSPVGAARYFQYRTILETDDPNTSCDYGSGATWCSPELKRVTVAPSNYPTSAAISSMNGIPFWSLASFAETLGAAGCSSGVKYNLSLDKVTWYWWDSAANAGAGGWVAADGTVTKANTAAVISTNAATFATQVGRGTVYMKAFLQSSGASACELDQVSVTGTQ